MILVVVLTTAGHFRSVLSVFGTFGVLAAVVYTVVCVGIGWLLGGSPMNVPPLRAADGYAGGRPRGR